MNFPRTSQNMARVSAAVLVVACLALFVVFAAPQKADAATLSIASSTRFISGNSDYLSKTFGGAGTSNKIVTFSAWVKRGDIASDQYPISYSNDDLIRFNSGNTVNMHIAGTTGLTTTAVYRDPAKWMHMVMVIDTTQATEANRVKFYIDNVSQTLSGTYPSQNT